MLDFLKKKVPAQEPGKTAADIPGLEDIPLYDFHVSAFSGGEPFHIMESGTYIAAEGNVYIEKESPNGKSVKKIPIPQEVEKTKDSIIEYLRNNAGVYIPG